jgi:glutathione S-transferase
MKHVSRRRFHGARVREGAGPPDHGDRAPARINTPIRGRIPQPAARDEPRSRIARIVAGMLKILGRSSSINVRKVLWTCDELGLRYEQEAYGTGFAPTDTPAFCALNPNALVPVLQDGDFVLWESNAICRYLAAREARTDLLPAMPQARAHVEQWMDWQATELNDAWRYAFLALVRRSPAHRDATAIDASAAAWNRQMTIADAQLTRTGAHMAGASFTLADVVVGLSVHRWFLTPIERPDLPAVDAYYARLRERIAFRVHALGDVP